MVEKEQYYAEGLGLDWPYLDAGQRAEANAIANADPGYVLWQAAQAKLSQARDIQKATVLLAVVVSDVFNLLNAEGVLDITKLSDETKQKFATLTALVDSYVG